MTKELWVVVETGSGWDNPDVTVRLVTDSKSIAKEACKKFTRPLGNGWEAGLVKYEVPFVQNWEELDKMPVEEE